MLEEPITSLGKRLDTKRTNIPVEEEVKETDF